MEANASDKVMVLGFDVRDSLDRGYSPDWTPDQRSQFLIRPEVRRPVSVDRDVWPSPGGFRDEHPLSLWSSLSEILDAYPEVTSAEPRTLSVIEVGAVYDEQSWQYWHGVFYGLIPEEGALSIRCTPDLLGYDVADRYLVSGLSNCAPSREEMVLLRELWSPQINSFGLFSDPEPARGFRDLCDRRVQEHAPFCVYRIRVMQFSGL